MTFTHHTSSESETAEIAHRLAACLQPRDVLALQGELGAGKTFFVRAVAEALGIDARQVSSPTFTLCQQYAKTGGTLTFVHIDAYRLASEDELETIGWDELLQRDDVIIAVEWSDRIAKSLPTLRTVRIDITHTGEHARKLQFTISPVIADRFRRFAPVTRPCRTCSDDVAVTAPEFPFCSERCRLVDLGEWFDEKHKISRPMTQADLDQGE